MHDVIAHLVVRRPRCSSGVDVEPRTDAEIRRVHVAGTDGNASALAPPTSSIHKVANAITSQSRATRVGSVIRVLFHPQPSLLVFLNECSIHARIAYHDASAACGGRSVRMSQGSS